ncbi:hypothetical protein L3X38_028710 [Prunus dulcis]|uniref:Mediator of RNA polymerase II transcription subunit 10 n=1 Tax=Prunus dulcis TaxID=3755 RepID=A0AAD4VQG8_PRUDU|nr:hypothetical protein L3X38_028710 [Prunus dulcis]
MELTETNIMTQKRRRFEKSLKLLFPLVGEKLPRLDLNNKFSPGTFLKSFRVGLGWIHHRMQQLQLKILGLIHQLYLTISSFNAASQLPLIQRLNALVIELDNMAKLSEKCNIQVPMEVFNLIDDGKNPDEFTRDVINSCIAKNQITKGKTDTFKSLRQHLLEELEQTFPDEVESYREIRAASASETKRLAQAQSILQNGDMKVKPEP